MSRSLTVFGSAGLSTTVAVSPVADPARAFPRLTGTLFTGAGRDVAAATLLGNDDLGAVIDAWTGAAFDLTRASTAEAVNHRYYSETIEDLFPADLRPAHGLYLRELDDVRLVAGITSFTTPVAVPGIVNPGQCIVWPIARRSANTGQEGSDAAMTAYLTGANKVQIDRGQALAAATLSYAVPEFGTAWTVRHLTLSTTTRGTDVPIPGCGAEPWSQKAYVATWRAPAGADQLADIPILRASPSDPDAILYLNPTGGSAGTFDISVYVLYRAGLAVQHWNSIDFPAYGDLPAVEVDWLISLPQSVAGLEDRVSLIGSATNTGPNADYPKMHLGYTLEPGGAQVRWRRGRPPGRPTSWALQAIRWPDAPSDPYWPRGEIVCMRPVGMIGR